MRRIVIFVLTITFSLGLADWGIAWPLGLTMGMKLSEFSGLKKGTKTGLYQPAEVPKPQSAFESYGLVFGPTTGLCRIMILGKTVATSAYGTELKSAFDNLEKRLKAQYGKNKRHDLLGANSIGDKPREFMTGLLKKERLLASYWSAEDGSTMRDHLKTILIEANAYSDDKGYISVSYEFENFKNCTKELEAAEDDAL
jgi:hypothetical protein